MNVYLIVLLVYSSALIAIGLWLGRRVKQAADFFVAGRSLGPVLVFATILAANIGAGSTVGATGLGYRDGLGAWWWVGSAGLGTLLLAFWVGPRIRRLAAEHGYYTVGDLLEHRYGPAARGAVAVLLWFGTVAVLVTQLVALHVHLGVVTGMSKGAAVLIGGVVVTVYFAAGGLRGAASIHLIQLVVLLLTFVAAVPIVWARAGGWEAIAAAPDLAPAYLNFLGNERTGWILVLLVLPNFVISPGLVQKVYGARDDRAVRIGVGAAAAVLLVFAFVPAVLGMSAHVLHPGLAPDEALPTLFRDSVPLLVGALGIGAIFMAEVSTSDAVLFMLSTSWSQDIYRRFIRPGATEDQVLRMARISAVAGGAVAVLGALVAETILGPLKFFYSIVAVILFVPVVAGLYTGRAGPLEAFSSFAAGIGVWGALQFYGWAGATGWGIVASAVAFTLVFLRARLARRQAS